MSANTTDTQQTIQDLISLTKKNSYDNSSGVNISQVVISALLEGLHSMNPKKAGIMGVSVGLSNFVSFSKDNINKDYSGSLNEKFVFEPLLAAILYTIGSNLLDKKNKNYIKDFMEGLIVSAASAGITPAVINTQNSIPLSTYDEIRDNQKISKMNMY